MKTLLLTLLVIVSLSGCSKPEDVNPNNSVCDKLQRDYDNAVNNYESDRNKYYDYNCGPNASMRCYTEKDKLRSYMEDSKKKLDDVCKKLTDNHCR